MDYPCNINEEYLKRANKAELRRIRNDKLLWKFPAVALLVLFSFRMSVSVVIIVAVLWIISDLLVAALYRREKEIIRAIKTGNYFLREDVVTNKLWRDIYAADIDRGADMHCYLSFANTRVKFGVNNGPKFDEGTKVVLQIMNYQNEEMIINVFRAKN